MPFHDGTVDGTVRRDLLFCYTAFVSFRREPVGWLHDILGDVRDAGPTAPDELPNASGQEQLEAQVDRLHGERRVAGQRRRAPEEEAQHPVRRGDGLLFPQGAGFHLRTFPGKSENWSLPPPHLSFQLAGNLCVTSQICLPFLLFLLFMSTS